MLRPLTVPSRSPGLLLTDSDFWMEQRRFVLRQLKEFGFGRRTMAALVQDEAGELARSFEDKLREKPEGVIAPMHDAFGEHQHPHPATKAYLYCNYCTDTPLFLTAIAV